MNAASQKAMMLLSPAITSSGYAFGEASPKFVASEAIELGFQSYS